MNEPWGAWLADRHRVFRRALEWADRHHVDASGGGHGEHGHGVLSTTLAIFLRLHLQSLREVSERDRLSWGRYLTACQKSDTGFFVDPALGPPEAAAEVSTADDDNPATGLVTCFVLQALKVLDTPATSALHFMDALGDRRAVEAWLESADWSNAALQSERMMCVLVFLIQRAELEQKPSALVQYHRILDWCEAIQHSKTGLIGVAPGNVLLQSIVATDRLVPFFTYVHRPIRRVASVVDTILSIQESDDGLARSRGSAREALAAVNLLGLLGRHSTYRSADVKEALIRSYGAIVAMQREDGSFPETRTSVPESHLFDATALAGPSMAGDLLSLWIRVLTLTIIERRYPDKFPAGSQWRFQPWPGLGYHSSGKTLTDHERQVLPRWIRQTSCREESRAAPVISAPAVSVVVPCYNLGRYLHEAVESVLAQKLDGFEILVVDDGSTDEYTQLLLDHFDRPGTKIIRQSNQGVAAARNNGIRASAGRYICCLDPDDRLRPGFLAKAIAVLDRHDDVGLVSGSIAEFDEREQIFRRKACALRDLLTENPIVEPAVFRRQAWEKVGGYHSGFSASGIEDWDLWLSILEAGYRAEVLPDIVWDYRIHADQMSTGMNRPETWGKILRELASRHSASYHEHMHDVVGGMALQFAESRAWAAECRWAAVWWERQSGIWQRQAEALEDVAGGDDQKGKSRRAPIEGLQRRLLKIERKRLTRRVSLWLAKLGRNQQ
jgi:GT2 family glycosyltransferase